MQRVEPNGVYDWGREEIYGRFFEVEADWVPDGISIYVQANWDDEGHEIPERAGRARKVAEHLHLGQSVDRPA